MDLPSRVLRTQAEPLRLETTAFISERASVEASVGALVVKGAVEHRPETTAFTLGQEEGWGEAFR